MNNSILKLKSQYPLCYPPKIFNAKSESECKLWTWDDNNVSILVHQFYIFKKCIKLMQDINNRGNKVGKTWLNRNPLCNLSVNLRLLYKTNCINFIKV